MNMKANLKPITQYTKSGRLNIAYQIVGDGPIDIVYIPGWISNIDLMWENPQLSYFLLELTKIARVILFDKRGTGLSDRFIELSTLEDRMDDIRAVMDAAGSERAVLFGHSEGGSVSALFAATYPERTLALITFGVFAKRRYSKDYPWAPTREERQIVYDMIENNWGSGEMDLASLAPSMADDKVFMNWLSSYFRSGASPSAALVLTKINTQVDIIDILDTIEVPSLFMCRTHDIDVKVEESKFMAERVRGSKMVEFSGHDHLFWVGNSDEVLDEIVGFLTGSRASEKNLLAAKSKTHMPDRVIKSEIEGQLATVISMHISMIKEDNSTNSELHSNRKKHVDNMRQLVAQYLGQTSKTESKNYTAIFKGPSKAVHCALDIRRQLQIVGIKVHVGIHTGECAIGVDEIALGKAVEVSNAILDSTTNAEVLISSTTKNLLSGAGLDFSANGHVTLTKSNRTIEVFLVQDVFSMEDDFPFPGAAGASTKNHSFLENILQSIETHLDNEHFSVEELCKDVGVSQRQLQRKLKSITNKTPSQMVRSVRLYRAKELLIKEREGVSEAAFRTGFSSRSYFTKCFRQEFGMTPSEMAGS